MRFRETRDLFLFIFSIRIRVGTCLNFLVPHMPIEWRPLVEVNRGLTLFCSDAMATFFGSPVDLAHLYSADSALRKDTWTLCVRCGQLPLSAKRADGTPVMPLNSSLAATPAGLCIFTLKDIGKHNATFHLIGLKVEAVVFEGVQGVPEISPRRLGIGTALLLQAHAMAFAACQQAHMVKEEKMTMPRECDSTHDSVDAMGRHRFTFRPSTSLDEMPTLTHHVGLQGPGTCRTDASCLRLLEKFGYLPFGQPTVGLKTEALELLHPYRDPDHLGCPVTFKPCAEWGHELIGPLPHAYLRTTTQAMNSVRIRIASCGSLTSVAHGLVAFTVPARVCQDVLALVENPALHGSDSRGKFMTAGGINFYAMKDYVGAQSATHNRAAQQRVTLITDKSKNAARVLANEPAFEALARHLLHGVGLRGNHLNTSLQDVLCIHLFQVDIAGHAVYGWHADCKDLAITINRRLQDPKTGKKRTFCELDALGIRSLVVQLGASELTGMCMYGHAPSIYQGQGAAVGFNGSCIHTSIPWAADETPPEADAAPINRRAVWKVSMFWLPADLGCTAPEP